MPCTANNLKFSNGVINRSLSFREKEQAKQQFNGIAHFIFPSPHFPALTSHL